MAENKDNAPLVIVAKNTIVVKIITKKNRVVIGKTTKKLTLGRLSRELNPYSDSLEVVAVHRSKKCPLRNFCSRKEGKKLSCFLCWEYRPATFSVIR
ncbi:MAG: hypothetical protein AAB890_01510 [Patescibacteria group bacterium]